MSYNVLLALLPLAVVLCYLGPARGSLKSANSLNADINAPILGALPKIGQIDFAVPAAMQRVGLQRGKPWMVNIPHDRQSSIAGHHSHPLHPPNQVSSITSSVAWVWALPCICLVSLWALWKLYTKQMLDDFGVKEGPWQMAAMHLTVVQSNHSATSSQWSPGPSPRREHLRKQLSLNASITDPSPIPAGEVKRGAILLRTKGLAKSFGPVPQFQSVDIMITQGQRIGLLGINGAGKSTFMKCIAGLEGIDEGSVEITSGCKVLYVDQEPEWQDPMKTTLKQALFSTSDPRAEAMLKYYAAMESGDIEALTVVTDALQKLQGIWDFEAYALSTAQKLGLGPELYDVPVGMLSGGQRKRLGLASSFALQPDVVLLDEPTNHLDIDGIEYLIDFLNSTTKTLTVMLVTHDRYLIQRVCDQIMELDRSAVSVYPPGCSYDKYLELRAERIATADAVAQAARVKLRREAEWMRKQPKARATKARSRIDAFYTLQEVAKGRGADPSALALTTKEDEARQKRLGSIVAEFEDASVSVANRTLVSGFTYQFRQRDRIGLVGPNGAGKTTFLRALLQIEPLSAGTMRLGETVCMGYFEQAGLQLDEETGNMTVLKFVQEAVEAGMRGEIQSVGEAEARQLLNRFNFPSRRWNDKVAFLSGGELRRLQLLKVLALRPNFLVLDEPTNDLDLSTVQALETYLTEQYTGAVICVSHDRYFMDRVADHLFAIEENGVIKDYLCSFSEYIEAKWEEEQAKAAAEALAAAASVPKAAAASSTNNAALFREQSKEMDRLESQIQKLSAKLDEWNAKLSASDGTEDYNELSKWMAEANKIKEQIAQKEERWLELSEILS